MKFSANFEKNSNLGGSAPRTPYDVGRGVYKLAPPPETNRGAATVWMVMRFSLYPPWRGGTQTIVPVQFTCETMVFPQEGGQHSVTSRRIGVKLLHIYSLEVCMRTTFHRHRRKWSDGAGGGGVFLADKWKNSWDTSGVLYKIIV